MAKKIFEEKQRSKRWDIIALLAFLILALTWRFVDQQFIHYTEGAMSLATYLLCLLPLAAALAYVLILRLSVRITNKHISLKYYPWHRKRHKIKWENIEDCKIVKTCEAAQWNGWNVNFSHEQTYSVCGRNGLHLTTHDGEEIFVGSKSLGKLAKAVKKVFNGKMEIEKCA